MTEHDVNVARDIGGLQADMRTVKHDLANVQATVSAGFTAVTAQLNAINLKREKSLGFVAGAAAVIGIVATLVAAALKLIFGAHA